MSSLKKLQLAIAVVAITVGAPNAFGFWLELIPTLSGDTGNDPNAITPDGKYVVGNSSLGTTTRGFLWKVGSGAANATYVVSDNGAASTVANGVGYRTYNSEQQLIISGLSSGFVTEWMTPDGGLTFPNRRRNSSYTLNTVNGKNQLGSPGNTDEYYVTSRNTSQLQLDINRGTGVWPATITTSAKSVTGQARMVGIGATGRAVGSRVTTDTSVRQNYWMNFNPSGSPAANYFQGLNSVNIYQGEAFDVSDDGVYVTGWSGLGTVQTDSYAYKAKFSGTDQATWDYTYQLPVTGLEAGSTAKTVAYGISPDGRWVVGGSFQTIYHAMLWDTAGDNPANWSYIDLWDFAVDRGIMDGWQSIQRGYSVGLDPVSGAPIVTGTGVWSPDGGTTLYTRAWVMLIPEPSAIWMLLGGLGLLVGRCIWMRKRA